MNAGMSTKEALVATVMLLLLFNAGMSPIEVCKKIAVPMTVQKTVETSPAVMDVGPLIMGICKRGDVPVAARKAFGTSKVGVSVGATLDEIL
jgi:hypothetical protein